MPVPKRAPARVKLAVRDPLTFRVVNRDVHREPSVRGEHFRRRPPSPILAGEKAPQSIGFLDAHQGFDSLYSLLLG